MGRWEREILMLALKKHPTMLQTAYREGYMARSYGSVMSEVAFNQQLTRNWGPQSYSHKEINSAKSLRNLGSGYFPS